MPSRYSSGMSGMDQGQLPKGKEEGGQGSN
jgi:hypothetical protein